MLTIRDAQIEDCDFVARGICMALHRVPDDQMLKGVAKICERTDVLYSYKHSIVAWEDDIPVGICLCYDGGKYYEMRKVTFPLFADLMHDDPDHEAMDLENAEDEAVEGEYYVDSLAVMPEWRGRGIASKLMLAQMDKARALGYAKSTLLVDPDNAGAQYMYRKLGFADDTEIYAFGQTFWKWKKVL